MFAVLKTGGKQYKVQPNDILEVEKIEAGVGSLVVLDEVLLVNDGSDVKIGKPVVEGFGVSAEVIKQKKGDKIIVFKKKRRHNYRRKNGHRQFITVLKIKEIGQGLKSNILEFKPQDSNNSVVETKAEVKPTKAKTAKTTSAKKEAGEAKAKTTAKKSTKTTKA